MRTLVAIFSRRALALSLLAATAAASAQDKPPSRSDPLPYAAIQNFTDVVERIRADAVTPVDRETLLAEAAKGLLARVDPEGGEFYTKADYEDFRSAANLHFASVGLEVRARQGLLAVFPLEGGPAAAAGVRAGDWLRTIDGIPMAGVDPHDVIKRLRGDMGSKVVLGVARGDGGQVLRFEIERRSVSYLPVAVSRVDADVAVLHVDAFRSGTLKEVADALRQEWSRRPFKGLVLDLRHNNGGLLQGAVGMAAIFLQPDVLVVKTVGRIPDANQVFLAKREDYARLGEPDPLAAIPAALRAVPVVVLVDESTVSGAEIVAAALRDNKRAILVGHVTWGRGSIQTVMPLPGGTAMKLTTANFVTPSGQQIQGQGLKPDVPVASDDEAEGLQAAVAALRKRL